MRKIPTLYRRDPDDMKRVLQEVTPGCEWVLAGEGVATRKYDGTCCLIREGVLYARREVKPGKTPPDGFEPVDHDEATGKTVGWVKCADTPEYARHKEAFLALYDTDEVQASGFVVDDGTYELCGPKVNGNPEDLSQHVLIAHATAQTYPAMNAPQGFDELRAALTALSWEGIVWHHPDGRMAKLKRRDFPDG